MTQINPNQINLGNESAVDLLIERNTAKTNLANNLNGLGVNANANTESLNQLVSKVANVQADTTKQNVKSIVVNTPTTAPFNTIRQNYIIKNGFVFHINGTTLIYAKLSDMKTNASAYYTSTPVPLSTISNICTTASPTGTNDKATYIRRIWFTENGNYMYILNQFTTTIQRYTVTWGENNSTVAFSDMLTITAQNNGSNLSIDYIDVNDDNTKLLLTVYYQSAFHPAILDLTDIETTPTKNVTMLSATSLVNENVYLWTGNENYPICECLKQYCRLYSLSETTLSLYAEKTFTITKSNPIQFRRGINKFVDKKGNSHIICNVGYTNGGNTPDGQYAFVIINGANAEIVQHRCKINYSAGFYDYADVVTVSEKNNLYYVWGTMSVLIFDEDWNLVGNTTTMLNGSNVFTDDLFFYDGDLYGMANVSTSSWTQNYYKVQCWLDKKVAIAKNISIGGETQQSVYFAQPTTDNIESGLFD